VVVFSRERRGLISTGLLGLCSHRIGQLTTVRLIARGYRCTLRAPCASLKSIDYFLMPSDLETALRARILTLDLEQITGDFVAQDEFVQVENFLPRPLLDELITMLPELGQMVHRNYIPRHKKGGSVARYALDRAAPRFAELYRAHSLIKFLQTISGRDLLFCPPEDPHSYALYYYTEPGDHIGYHYDTSYYNGARYTVLIGLVDESSCRLEYQLHTKNPTHDVETLSADLKPGMLIAFNGDKLYHRITPLGHGERRIALTFEYLTNTHMHPFLRFVSNMKDSIAYFGFKQVFNANKQGTP